MNLHQPPPNNKGFTIVELLVVIVVIGILSTVAVAGYQGISKRAQDTTTLSLVNSWEKVVLAYSVDKGVYPLVGTTNRTFCLGSLPADDLYADGECEKTISGTNTPSTSPSTELMLLFQANKITYPSSVIKRIDFPRANYTMGFRGIQLKTTFNAKTNYEIYYPLASLRCKTGDPVAYEVNPSGVGLTGQSSPGTEGVAKLCVRQFPDLP